MDQGRERRKDIGSKGKRQGERAIEISAMRQEEREGERQGEKEGER